VRVLFVCSGNICRSPMAAEYMRHRAVHDGLSHLVVDSAGTLGIHGAPASPEAVLALHEIGLDLRGHRSKGIGPADLHSADLVIAMCRGHLVELSARFPGAQPHAHVLRAFEAGPRPCEGAPDLTDPIGEPVEVYREQLRLMRRCIDHLTLYLKHGAAGADGG
jgi:protein-tyrosine-phosphatase